MSAASAETRPARSRWVRFTVSCVVAAVLLAALAVWGGVDWSEMRRTLVRLPPTTFALALAIHTAIYVARAQRFRLLMPIAERPGLLATLCVSSAHNLAVYVLPAKTGEATLPIYLKSACGVPTSVGLASLLVSRLLDLATLCGMLALVTAWLALGPHWNAPRWAGGALVFVLIAATILFFSLGARGERVVATVQSAARFARLDRTILGRKLVDGGARLATAMRIAGADGRVVRALPWSIAIWLGVFTFYAVLAEGFGLPEHVGFVEASFGSSLAVLTNLLPINAFAGIGTQETGWVLGFGLVGVAADISLPNSIGVHLVQLFDTLLFGVIGHVGMGMLRRR